MWLTTKRLIIGAVLLVVVGGIVYWRSRPAPITYETTAVEQRKLMQTVEVTGEMKPADRIDLGFQASGKLQKINVKVGDVVKPGEVLAELVSVDQQFAVRNVGSALAVASANLSARLVGETAQSIRVAETGVEQAQANYDKAVADVVSTRQTVALDVNSAQNNLNNQDVIVTKNIVDALDGARTKLFGALGPIAAGMSDGDQIVGVDNTASNAVYTNLLGFLDAGSLDRAKNSYRVAKSMVADADASVRALTSMSTKEQILDVGLKIQKAAFLVQAYLADVQHVLANTITGPNFNTTELAAKKATIDADYASVSSQNSLLLTAIQSVKNTELIKTQTIQALQDALNLATTNAEVKIRSAETTVTLMKAALDSANAVYELKRSPPRDVDVAAYRASVGQAAVAYEKAVSDLKNYQIIASISGTIAEIIPSVGEQVTMNARAIALVGEGKFDVEAKVPESDIAKIVVGQHATITLDAYGDDVKFSGIVTIKDPAETKVQDAVYYIIRVTIDPNGKEVKPGMTANVTVETGSVDDAIVIPIRAIRTSVDGKKTVRVLVNGKPEERDVIIGLRGDEGRVQILSGVAKDEQVIVSDSSVTATK